MVGTRQILSRGVWHLLYYVAFGILEKMCFYYHDNVSMWSWIVILYFPYASHFSSLISLIPLFRIQEKKIQVKEKSVEKHKNLLVVGVLRLIIVNKIIVYIYSKDNYKANSMPHQHNSDSRKKNTLNNFHLYLEQWSGMQRIKDKKTKNNKSKNYVTYIVLDYCTIKEMRNLI